MDAIFTEKTQRLAGEIAAEAKLLDDVNGLIKLMLKSALERMLDTEMDVHLGRTNPPPASSPHAMAIPVEMLPEKRRTRNHHNGRSAVRNTCCVSFSGGEGSTLADNGARTGSGLAECYEQRFTDFCGG
jgi:hypothetical protein